MIIIGIENIPPFYKKHAPISISWAWI